jgi:hypothetical protein
MSATNLPNEQRCHHKWAPDHSAAYAPGLLNILVCLHCGARWNAAKEALPALEQSHE